MSSDDKPPELDDATNAKRRRYDRQLRLPSNNCRTFVNAVVDAAARATATAAGVDGAAVDGAGGGEGENGQQPRPLGFGKGASREMQGSVFGLQTPVPTNAAEYAAQYAALLLIAAAAAAGSGAFFLGS